MNNASITILVPIEDSRDRLREVRDDTADLASYGRHGAGRFDNVSSSPQNALLNATDDRDDIFESTSRDRRPVAQRSKEDFRNEVIHEVSEPSSSEVTHQSQSSPLSLLDEDASFRKDRLSKMDPSSIQKISHPINGRGDRVSLADEHSSLLPKKPAARGEINHYHVSTQDVESQCYDAEAFSFSIIQRILRYPFHEARRVSSWLKDARLQEPRSLAIGIGLETLHAFAPLIIGILMNILDALSYGRIMFPLGEPVFADLAPAGISMFYVSTIVSQLVYSLGGSGFKAGVGSEMIEVIPFFYQMAFKILKEVGSDDRDIVRSTTFLAYTLSSVLTGVTFLLMSRYKLGELIGFFPHHVLTGCIGGIGLFLVQTGLDVSADFEGQLGFDLETIRKLFEKDTLPHWIIPLALVVTLMLMKYYCASAFVDAAFYCGLLLVFHIVVAAIPHRQLKDLQRSGWVFEGPQIDLPWYSFYSLYSGSWVI